MRLGFIYTVRVLFVFIVGLLLMQGPVSAWHAPHVSVSLPPVSVVAATRFSKSLNEFATVFTHYLHVKMGNNVQVTQMQGEGGMVGADYVSQAAGDGSVFLLSTHSTQSINGLLHTIASYSPEEDLVNIGVLGTFPAALVVSANSPFNTFSQLLEAIHQDPADYRMGYYNSTSQVAAGLFNYYTNQDIKVLPYKSREMFVRELEINGIQFAFIDGVFVADLLEDKKIKVLATTGVSPVLDMNEVPLTTTLHPDFVLEGWMGVAAPKNVPDNVLEEMRGLVRGAVADPAIKEAMKKTGFKTVNTVCVDFDRFIKHETERWRKRILLAGIKPR